ncbi:MAG: energy-coupling factor ABC transporter ATP-binding protein [Spirochaetaceae bacterium]|jgi:biotin transport system ATP-binding protein|nr:energy-coupling factor ABC transporter ATP-binding protein [Spirochaetaceae bacterium]
MHEARQTVSPQAAARDPEKEKKALFSIRNLSKIFTPFGEAGVKGEVRAVSGINLEIYAGECLIIAGSNGSGKTLLMRMVAGLLDSSEGEIRFQGTPIDRAAGRVRRHTGLVFQDADAQIIGETVAEDIAFGPKNLGFSKPEVEERVGRALDALGLSEKKTFPPRRLSGGEKRRLAVAGVLAMGCETIIMDEPFANLDWPGVTQVLEIIRDLRGSGKTVVILTHELEKVLAFADRLVILDRGMIRDEGKPQAVLDRLKPEYGVRDPRRNYARVEDCTWLENPAP